VYGHMGSLPHSAPVSRRSVAAVPSTVTVRLEAAPAAASTAAASMMVATPAAVRVVTASTAEAAPAAASTAAAPMMVPAPAAVRVSLEYRRHSSVTVCVDAELRMALQRGAHALMAHPTTPVLTWGGFTGPAVLLRSDASGTGGLGGHVGVEEFAAPGIFPWCWRGTAIRGPHHRVALSTLVGLGGGGYAPLAARSGGPQVGRH
jgi:hypothetical protein